MDGNSDETYEVGFKKPPKATQFKKGKSGNPSGRPKKAPPEVDPGTILRTIDHEEITVMVDGKRKRMTRIEVEFRKLSTRAIKGDLTAVRLFLNMASEYFVAEEQGTYGIEVISETEAAKRFGRNWRKRVNEHNDRFRH